MSADSPPLSPKLEEILQSLPDRHFAERLRRVYVAAGQAIARLGDLDLLRYESGNVDSSPDLSLWEEMAPVIRDTVMDVNVLLNVIREQFSGEPLGSLEELPGEGLMANLGARRLKETAELLLGWMMQLAQGVTQLGEAMRNPAVVSDRWTLLAELQRFRALFRAQIANLVYESASSLGQVTRAQVVPGHDEEVKAAVMVRAIVTDLARIIMARLRKVEEAGPEEIQWHAQQLQTELDAFGRTAAYRNLRAQDKRHVIELRGQVGQLAIHPRPRKSELLGVTQELNGFVRSLSHVNQRQILIIHDREVWAGCGVRLERALMLLGTDEAGAARALAEAAASAQALYGRDSALDSFLRKTRKAPLGGLTGPELRATIESLQILLARLEVM